MIGRRKLGLAEFLSLAPSDSSATEALQRALKTAYGGRVDWKGIKSGLLAEPELPWNEAQLEAFRRNVSRKSPQGGSQKAMAVLYWLSRDLKDKDVQQRLNQAAADACFKLFQCTVEEEYERRHPAPDDLSLASRWKLRCIENDTIDETLCSFAFDDSGQHPTTIGSLGVFIEIFCTTRMREGIEYGFTKLVFRTDLNTDMGAKISYPAAYKEAKHHPIHSHITMIMKGTRLGYFWEAADLNDLIDGTFPMNDVELFSISPNSENFQFSSTMSARLKDFRATDTEASDGNKEAIFASLFARTLDEEARQAGTVHLSKQRYEIYADQ